MTTHKAHTNLFHNQCLALQAIAILLERAGIQGNYRAAWIYERAGRTILPELWEGVQERPIPVEFLPKVIVEDPEFYEKQTLPGGFT